MYQKEDVIMPRNEDGEVHVVPRGGRAPVAPRRADSSVIDGIATEPAEPADRTTPPSSETPERPGK